MASTGPWRSFQAPLTSPRAAAQNYRRAIERSSSLQPPRRLMTPGSAERSHECPEAVCFRTLVTPFCGTRSHQPSRRLERTRSLYRSPIILCRGPWGCQRYASSSPGRHRTARGIDAQGARRAGGDLEKRDGRRARGLDPRADRRERGVEDRGYVAVAVAPAVARNREDGCLGVREFDARTKQDDDVARPRVVEAERSEPLPGNDRVDEISG